MIDTNKINTEPIFPLVDINGNNGFVIRGIDNWDLSGTSVSSAGDVNGDGIDDLIIGAPDASNSNFGESYVVFGSSDKSTTTNRLLEFKINDNVFRDRDGEILTYSATLTDDSPLPSWLAFDPNTVTFSGIPISSDAEVLEIKLTATDPSNKSTSTNFTLTVTDNLFPAVIEPQYLNGSDGFAIAGIDRGDNLGATVSNAGDVNGDGIDDLIIGADNQSYVVFGSSDRSASNLDLSTLNGSNGFAIAGIDPYDLIDSSVSSAGDINGDGIDDLIIGTPRAESNGQNYAGKSYVIFGSSDQFASNLDLTTIDGTNGFAIAGIDFRDNLGESVSTAGDINGDGFDDLIIGVPGAKESYVIFGSSNEFASNLDLTTIDGTNGFVINGIDVSSDFLYSIAVNSAEDINGDGFDDLIIGATGSDYYQFDGHTGYSSGEHRAYVVFGTGENFDPELDLSTLNGSNGFQINNLDTFDLSSGWSVSSAGDINDDGIDDLIVGASESDYSEYGNYGGESYVVFGSSDQFASKLNLSTLNGTNGFTIKGLDQWDKLGVSVSKAGDINGDRIDDLIIGASGANVQNNDDAGASYVVFGSSDQFARNLDLKTLDGTNGFVISGINIQDELGGSVSNAGDVNGDGIDDLIVGASGANDNAGESYVIFGSSQSELIPEKPKAVSKEDSYIITFDDLNYESSASEFVAVGSTVTFSNLLEGKNDSFFTDQGNDRLI